jgi:hypothetical protein
MLEAFGVTEANWLDATERIPHFAIAEPTVRRRSRTTRSGTRHG